MVVRVTQSQYERIKNNAQAKGYKNISQFIRNLALEHSLTFESKFNEMYNIITKFESTAVKKFKRKNNQKEFLI